MTKDEWLLIAPEEITRFEECIEHFRNELKMLECNPLKDKEHIAYCIESIANAQHSIYLYTKEIKRLNRLKSKA